MNLSLQRLFQYLSMKDEPEEADLIMGFGVFDLRVPDHCAFLYRSGCAPFLLFSGGFGTGSGALEEPEAVVFRRRALENGVPYSSILIEPFSTNTKENVLASSAVLREKNVPHSKIVIVAQPHRQRRVWLTCRRWMPDVQFINHPPPTTFKDETDLFEGVSGFTASMMGEVSRIEEYGERGDIMYEEIPLWIKALQT